MDLQINHSSLLNSIKEQLFICPITHFIINQPYISSEGITYERYALQKWLSTANTDPKTNKPLQYDKPIPNFTLRKIIQKLQIQIPKIEALLSQKTQIIQNLKQELQICQKQLEQQRSINQANQTFVQSVYENLRKVKKINKQRTQMSNLQGERLKQKNKKISKYREIINKLKGEKAFDQKTIKSQELKIQQKQEQINILKQQLAQSLSQIQEKQNLIQDLQKKLVSSIIQSNNLIQQQVYYRQLIFFELQKLFQQQKKKKKLTQISLEQCFNKFKQASNMKQIVQRSIMGSINQQKQERLKKPNLDQQNKQIIDAYYFQIINFIRKINLSNKLNVQKFQQLTLFHDKINRTTQIGKTLKIIPFSNVPTDEELQIRWEKVIKICTGKQMIVTDQMWQNLINHIDRFPQIRSIKIENCQIKGIKEAQLLRINNLKEIQLKRANFNYQTQEQLRKYKRTKPNVIIKIQRKEQ